MALHTGVASCIVLRISFLFLAKHFYSLTFLYFSCADQSPVRCRRSEMTPSCSNKCTVILLNLSYNEVNLLSNTTIWWRDLY